MSLKTTTDKAGWLLVLALGLAFFFSGQWYLLEQGKILQGFYNLFACLLVVYWISWRRNFSIALQNALAVGLALVVYLWTTDWASTTYGVNSNIKLLPILAGLAMVFTLHSPVKPNPGERTGADVTYSRRTLRIFSWMLIIATIMILTVILAKTYLVPFDSTNVINFFFVLRSHGILGDIQSLPFSAWWRLWFPLLTLAGMLTAFWFILYRQERLGVWKSLLLIYLLGNVAGISIEYLATSGLEQLALEVKSIHYNFYNVAKTYKTFSDIWLMLETFATREIFQFHSFAMSHPPLNLILNWIWIHLTGDNPALIALIIGALAWTGIFPMFLLGRELYNRELGFYMAGLYAVLPNTLIINMVALDGLVTSFTAWTFAFMLMGSRRRGHGYMFLSGLGLAGFALTHYSSPILLPALFITAIMGLRSQELKLGAWLGSAFSKLFFFILGAGLPFLLLEMTTHWKFDYPAMMHYVVFQVYGNSIALHPWFVGSWLTWVNYFIFLSVPITTLFVLRWLDIIRGDWKNDFFPWAGLTTMVVPFVLGMARQETERAYMLFNVFVVATAVLMLWKGEQPLRYMLRASDARRIEEMGGGWRPMFFVVMALAFINAMIIEMLVVDHF
ncbi:MAG: glycosyltransferase family 39 protein [Candidatus Firestonebacteria bacterium]|nr:glycosyltransferase family 39 protein [Candidatus Firestonebacteria bacterium]